MSIKVNVGGEIFETTVITLKKINYFKYILEDTNYDNTQIIFVDRSAHIFKHVLALAINENYNYPYKYKDELDFYDMTYDINNLHSDKNDLLYHIKYLQDCNDNLETEIKNLKEYVGVVDNKVGILLFCARDNDTKKLQYYNRAINETCVDKYCFKNCDFCSDH